LKVLFSTKHPNSANPSVKATNFTIYLVKIVPKSAPISKGMMKKQANALIAQKEQLTTKKTIPVRKYAQEIRPLM